MQRSINDDLENFIIKLLKSEEIDFEDVQCFHSPKLTKEELKLVELKHLGHLLTYKVFHKEEDPDVGPERMKKSDSKDKFVHSICQRRTKYLTLPSSQNELQILKGDPLGNLKFFQSGKLHNPV